LKNTTGTNDITISINPVTDLQELLRYPFMQHAIEAGTVVAIIAGIVGYFVVLRRSSFAAHALSHVGFAGAAGAALLAVNPVYGLLLFTSVGGSAMAVLSPRAVNRDVHIGTVLAFMLGLGVLFVSLYAGNSTTTYSILFGEILGISNSDVLLTLIAGIVILGAVALVYRPLLFSSLDEDVAEAKGMPTFGLGIVFMLLVAVATSIAVQVVGVLLIFSLMVTPAAIAQQLAKRPLTGILVSVIIALMATWLGLTIAYFGPPYPVSFYITTLVFSLYLLVRFVYRRIRLTGSHRTNSQEI
jgi:zinc/manganese transport system permease protein